MAFQRRNVSLSLPNIEADNQTFCGLPVDFFDADFGTKISGIIGLDILKNFVVEIDYASRMISFYAPQSYHYSGNGESVSFIVGYKNLLFVPAVVKAADGKKLLGVFAESSGDERGIAVFDFDSSKYEKITDFGVTPFWFKDNRNFIFTAHDTIYLGDTKTKKITQLYKPSVYELQHASISPDNQMIFSAIFRSMPTFGCLMLRPINK